MQQNNQGNIKENRLIEAKIELKSLHQEKAQPKNRILRQAKNKQALHRGDTVRVLSYDQTGELLKQVDDTHWEVQVGIMRMKLAVNDLQKVQPEKQKEPKRRVTVVKGAGGGSTKLDLRGQRYEEAMHNLDQFIDASLLAGYAQVTIVHGLGTGAIRNGVTQYLQRNRQVKKFGFAPHNAGGSGAPIVQLK